MQNRSLLNLRVELKNSLSENEEQIQEQLRKRRDLETFRPEEYLRRVSRSATLRAALDRLDVYLLGPYPEETQASLPFVPTAKQKRAILSGTKQK